MAALAGAALITAAPALADQTRIRMNLLTSDGVGAAIGTIRAVDTGQGLRLTPLLKGLSPGPHGMEVHEKGDCGAGEAAGKRVPGLAAGGRFDPDKSGGPGERAGADQPGDIPALVVDQDGIARHPVTAPRLKLAQIKGRSIIIRASDATNADQRPAGDQTRIACGVIP